MDDRGLELCEYCSEIGQHLSLGLQEFSKSELNLRSINLHIVNISSRLFSGPLYWIEKPQEFYIYHLAYAGIEFFLFLLPLLHPVAQNFLRETNCFFLLNLNICIFSLLAVCLLLNNLYSNGHVIIMFWFYVFSLLFSLGICSWLWLNKLKLKGPLAMWKVIWKFLFFPPVILQSDFSGSILLSAFRQVLPWVS